ncbi:MAG: acyl-CoA thioesterase [Bacteroidetes bacterium]|nr:acyl-CoA thioesterase [Bacteroidota bacterium]
MTGKEKHRTTLSVRGYELDSYGHVNNAVYLQYLEHARWQFMKDQGLLEQVNAEGLFVVVVETQIRYVRESNLFDELVVETAMAESKPYLVFRQKILNNKTGMTVARAVIKTIFVDDKRMPLDIPGFILELIRKNS